MTDLQVKYQALLENERANKAQEAIKEREAAVKEKLAVMEEAQVPYRVQKMVSEANLTDQQKINLAQEVAKIQAQVNQINATTKLTNVEKNQRKQDMMLSLFNYVNGIFSRFGSSMDRLTGRNLIEGIFGAGATSTVSSAGKEIGEGIGSQIIAGLIA